MFFRESRGIIALDIDGTITAEAESIPKEVIDYFYTLYEKGWDFIFITGRPFQWGIRSLNAIPFPYALGVQNGALLLDMPTIQVIARKYLDREMLSGFETVCLENHTDFVIYSGLENKDRCYYRPERLPQHVLEYVHARSGKLGEKWNVFNSFDELEITSFAALKCFAKFQEALLLSEQIEGRLNLHAPLIRDPFSHEYFVVQATHAEATKGSALKEFLAFKKMTGPVLAAGNDYNDLSLLQLANVKIAMEDSPEDMLRIADIVAPSVTKNGIILGLEEGIRFTGGFHA
ncbi:MAG: HAD family phosphatase [Candidatus Protochlamydia sp.]|nr:HAD family phosphatase [Candidatus Protochlamydia sp.]